VLGARYEELRSRWDNLWTEAVAGGSASATSVPAVSQKDDSETVDVGDDNGDGNDIADETLGNSEEIVAEVPADIAPQKEASSRSFAPPSWFGWILAIESFLNRQSQRRVMH
jgi:hypothetical protein